ncbi:MAG: hypothetical protein LUH46_12455, partial [Alistipes sp.]|nr:hypothetical protein [Alistipes sp.]
MNKLPICLFAIGISAAASALESKPADLDSLLVNSGYIHSPLPVVADRSLEAEALGKRILDETELHSAAAPGKWSVRGEGCIDWQESTPTLCVSLDPGDRRAVGPANDPDYALYGHSVAVLHLNGISLEKHNRLEIDIEPVCPGCRVVNINLGFVNGSGATGKEFNPPTGHHLIQLKNNDLNRCFLEIADFRRDAMKELVLSFSINGRDLTTGDRAMFRIVRVAAQTVETTEKISG